MPIPEDYPERVYAGVLGKIIGVYIGRPFEGWTYEKIMAELGEIDGYVNHRMAAKPPLVVTDDDISGTFTFLRALADHGNSAGLTPGQIGQSWLNYLIEGRTILWWGGLGNSTEHTAYLRLKNGIPAPRSGSIALNGRLIAEQIGAQIFIDGWAMVAPGDPELAADLARRAASVSHDGEAVFAAQVLAAMEAQAFVEQDIDRLLDTGVSVIPGDSLIYRMIAEIREVHAGEPDWHAGRRKLAAVYNYENFGGNCHMVPNHGLVILSLLYGGGDFTRSMKVVNTAGWDTDCNAGNLGCLLGIRNGLAGFADGPDWRGPVADRLFLPTADGGRSITDAVIETGKIVNMGRSLAGLEHVYPKGGARFHFEFPGSVQAFSGLEATTRVENRAGHSESGNRSLAIMFDREGRAVTPTFILPEEMDMKGYRLFACPTLYSGQEVRARVSADQPAVVRVFLQVYNRDDQLDSVFGPEVELEPGRPAVLDWTVPDTRGRPIARIGLECRGEGRTVYLDELTWSGEPDVTFTRPFGYTGPVNPPFAWLRAWVDGMDHWEDWWETPFRLVQNHGRGLIIQGTREWKNYSVEADITPWLMEAGGIAVRVQGMRRYYSLELANNRLLRLVKASDDCRILAEKSFHWEVNTVYRLKIEVNGSRIRAWVDGEPCFDLEDDGQPLEGGAAAYILEAGHMASRAMRVRPAAGSG